VNDQFAQALAVLPDYLGQHVLLSVAALLLALLLAVPLVIVSLRSAALRGPVMALASLVQTIPGLALMALFYPVLLAISALLSPAGIRVPALGFLPALLALTLYALLPILRNAIAGLEGIDPAVRQAALSVGMTRRQMFWQVEAPLAAPVVMAGVRTAAVWTIGAATLATPVGQTSLGNYIFTGLQTENWVSVAFGCLASAALAIFVDALLGVIQRGIGQRRRALVLASLAVMGAAVALALAPLAIKTHGSGAERSALIGAKNFSEQFILAELISSRLQAAGFATAQRQGLGSAIAFRALTSGEIDVYVDYSGTLWTNILQRSETLSREKMNAEIARLLRERFGVHVVGSLGFENAYALVMTRDRAQSLGVADIAEVAPRASTFTFGADLEFLQRPEWKAIAGAYGLSFAATRSFTPTFMYRALQSGEADIISGFSSDGRIAADNLVVLRDSKGAIPAYDALLLVSARRAGDAAFLAALKPLLNSIDVESMRRANYSVDRDTDKLSPREAAQALGPQMRSK
jgi:osmoprotectant transport system permease protein